MSDPTTITGDQIRAAFDALGLDPDEFENTARVELTPHELVLTRHARNEQGRAFIRDGRVKATVTTLIKVDWASVATQVF